MPDKELQIYPTRKTNEDAERLAQALLRLVDHLTSQERAFFLKEGRSISLEVKPDRKSKGSAA